MEELKLIVGESPLIVPLLMMLVVAPIGFLDAFYYHIVKFRLFQRPASRGETITHIIRSLAFGLGALIFLKFEPHGWMVWLVGGLFALDSINTIVDVVLEANSRKSLGGVPPSEYLIHVVGAVSAGAITSAYFIQAWPLQSLEPSLSVLKSSLPWWIYLPSMGLVVGGFSLGILEAILLARSYLNDDLGPVPGPVAVSTLLNSCSAAGVVLKICTSPLQPLRIQRRGCK